MTLEELNGLIKQWAIDRGIAENSHPKAQVRKTAEEIHELIIAEGKCRAMSDMNAVDFEEAAKADIKDAIGDIYVTLGCGLATQDLSLSDMDLMSTEKAVSSADLIELLLVFSEDLTRGRIDCYQETVAMAVCVLTVIAEDYGFTLVECVEHAYDQIKDRKGYLNKEGIFVKGFRVKCVSNVASSGNNYRDVVVGRVYDCVRETPMAYHIIDDAGEKNSIPKDCFVKES
jgi:hypothetical protein